MRKFIPALIVVGVSLAAFIASLVFHASAAPATERDLPDAMGGHSCWTSGEHPMPTHVVLRRVGHDHEDYYGWRMTGKALDALFKPGDSLRQEGIAHLTAFCK